MVFSPRSSSRLAMGLVIGALAVLLATAASAATGVLYVADLNGKLVRIDLATGSSSLVTSGGLLPTAVGIALETSTTVLVSNVGGTHSIVRVNLSSGAQTLVSSGNLLQNPDGLAYDSATGIVYVAQYPLANVVAVNVSTGAQTLVTQGGFLSRASWVTLGPDGMLYVTDSDGSKIVRVDKTTGAQSVVSSGNLIQFPEETTFGSDGLLYVADLDGKRVLKINVATGVQTLVSQGGNLVRPIGLGFDANGILYTSNADFNNVISVNPSNGAQGVYTSSFLSQPYGVLVQGAAPPPPAPPGAPASITASDNGPDGIDIRWNDVANESGYHLFRNGVSIATLGSNDTSYFDTPAVGDYQYCVDAFNLGGASAAVCDSGSRREVISAPRISFVKDLPNDQGGKVAVGWLASELDALSGNPRVTQYRVWRRLPPSLYGSPGASPLGSDASTVRMRPTSDGVTYWEAVATLPAARLAGYGYTATTSQDSLPGSNPFTAFFVSALTNTSTVFFDSEIDSGYSVDNLVPASPAPLTGSYSGGATLLHWHPNTEADLAGYRVYRGSSAGFVPGPASQIGAQADTGFADPGAAGSYYKVSALDIHGNESPFALLSPSGTVGVPESGVTGFALAAPWPNPARVEAELFFALPAAGPASLRIYDAQGRVVRDLVRGERPAGRQSARWNGRDQAGRAVGSGIYFARLSAAGRTIDVRFSLTQ